MSAVTTSTPPTTPLPRGPHPIARQYPLRPISVSEYEDLIAGGAFANERIELLDGHLVPKMSRDPSHDGTLDILEGLLIDLLPTGWFLRVQKAIRLAPQSMPEPDLAIVRGSRRAFLSRHPGPSDIGFVVEVANTSLNLDRDEKSRIYAIAGIAEYWLVDLVARAINVFQRPEQGEYADHRTVRVGETIPIVLDGSTVGTLAVAELLGTNP